MEDQKNTTLKSTMNYGLLLGLALILFSLILYIFDVYDPPTWVTVLNYAVVFAGIVYGTIKHRDDDLGGEISYGKALGTGVLITLFASIISSFFILILSTVIDPSYMENIYRVMEEAMYEQGLTMDQIDDAMVMMQKFQNPVVMFIMGVVGFTFFGTLFSLITSIFIKKEKPLFDQED